MNTRSILICASILVLAMLACNAPSAPLPTATDFVTVPSGTEVSATSAQTLTPLAATPTQFAGSTNAPAACPTAGSATLPTVPPAFAEYAKSIEAYLSGGGSVEGLQSTLVNWESIDNNAGGVVNNRDLTGDAVPEVIVTVHAPPSQFEGMVFPPGDLYIFACTDGAFEIIHGDYSTPDRPTPEIIAVEDVNQNGRSDVVYTTHFCGAHTCSYDVHVIEWNPLSSVFSDLLLNVVGVPSATVTVENQDGGSSEIVVEAGGIGSAGAGPQLLTQDTYIWNGSAFELGDSIITTPLEQWFPIHYLMDADSQMDEGAYDAAVSRYQEMLALSNPQILSSADEIPALGAYARFRLIVAHVLRGDNAAAQSVYEGLFAEYETDPAKPGSGFAAMADLFWNSTLDGGSIGQACDAVTQYAEANPASYEILNQFGYANKLYEPADLCPFE